MFQQDPQADGSATTNPDNLQLISRADFEALKASSQRADRRFKKLRSWDFAGSKDAGDFSCGMATTYDTMSQALYIEGALHGQFSAGQIKSRYEALAKQESEGGDEDSREYVIEQEPGSAGIFAAEGWKDLAPTRKVRVVKSTAEGSKLLKAQPFIAATENKKVVLVVENLEDYSKELWVQKFIDEFTAFPEGAHDDMMDAAANAYNDATGKKFKGGSFGRSAEAKAAQEQMRGGDGSLESVGAKNAPRSRATFGRMSPATARPKSRRSYFGVVR